MHPLGYVLSALLLVVAVLVPGPPVNAAALPRPGVLTIPGRYILTFTPAVSDPAAKPRGDATRLTAVWKGRSPAASADAVWVPTVSGILILVAGAMSLATKQPWLFAGLGPTAVAVASSPGHSSTRFHNIVVGHAVGFVCA